MAIANKKVYQYDYLTIDISIFSDDGTKLKVGVKNDQLVKSVSEVFDFGNVSSITSFTRINKTEFLLVCKNNYHKCIDIWKLELIQDLIPALHTVPKCATGIPPEYVPSCILYPPQFLEELTLDCCKTMVFIPYQYSNNIDKLSGNHKYKSQSDRIHGQFEIDLSEITNETYCTVS